MKKKSILVKLILTVPAIILGFWKAFVSTIEWLGLMPVFVFLFEPLIKLWSDTPQQVQVPSPKSQPEVVVDRQEDHDFH